MGGAACWQFAVHYPTLWAAAAPGAGFSETPEFLNVFQNEKVQPTWYEKKLWQLYDATDYAVEPVQPADGRLQRRERQAEAGRRRDGPGAEEGQGMELTHIIGPKTGHSYHPEAKAEINRRIDAIAAKGRDPVPDAGPVHDLHAALQPVRTG